METKIVMTAEKLFELGDIGPCELVSRWGPITPQRSLWAFTID